MVTSAPVGVSGVCSVAGLVGVGSCVVVGIFGFCSVAGCVGVECSRDGISGVCSVARRVLPLLPLLPFCSKTREVLPILPFDLPIAFWA